MTLRAAKIERKGNRTEREVMAYMPRGFAVAEGSDAFYILGADIAGWTLHDYVIPRLGSGIISAKEIDPDDVPLDVLNILASRLRHPSRLGDSYYDMR